MKMSNPIIERRYDSTADTLWHIKRVNELLLEGCEELQRRARVHDTSKLEDPEKATFDEFTPKLRDSVYGSEEYEGFRRAMAPALAHHYQHNSHHPEHYENGIEGMDLFDLVEMMVDWKAATERHTTGDIFTSLMLNTKRFNISPQLERILFNTIVRYLDSGASLIDKLEELKIEQ